MRIKTTKKMRLDELIRYVWDNDIKDKAFSSDFPEEVHRNKLYVHPDASVTIGLSGGNRVDKSLIYTVEVEEELTKDTVFDTLTEYIYDYNDDHHFTAEHKGANIRLIIDCEAYQFKTQAIYYKDTLVWTKEHGIPEEGVIEV